MKNYSSSDLPADEHLLAPWFAPAPGAKFDRMQPLTWAAQLRLRRRLCWICLFSSIFCPSSAAERSAQAHFRLPMLIIVFTASERSSQTAMRKYVVVVILALLVFDLSVAGKKWQRKGKGARKKKWQRCPPPNQRYPEKDTFSIPTCTYVLWNQDLLPLFPTKFIRRG